MRRLYPIFFLVILGVLLHAKYQQKRERDQAQASREMRDSRSEAAASQGLVEYESDERPAAEAAYRCDGRERCAQMTSCEEATWFINHCPDTKMDGDDDGIPCETQWCAHLR